MWRGHETGQFHHKINVFVSFAGTSVTKFNFFKFQSMSILVIHCNRRQETVSMPRHSLKQKKKLDYYFRNSVAKTRCSFLQDSKLLVSTWRHDGHAGGPKHFSPLETKPYFHVNSWRKKKYFVLTTNMEKKDSLQILGLPRFAYLLTSEQVWRKKNYRYTDE